MKESRDKMEEKSDDGEILEKDEKWSTESKRKKD